MPRYFLFKGAFKRMKLKINKKLEALVACIETDNVVADIGCDHAYLLIESVFKKQIKKGIGVDVKKGPLDSGETNINRFGLGDILSLRLGNGLEPISLNEVNTVVIAGMGGYTIVDILEKSLSKVNNLDKLILQPMTEFGLVRKFLKDNSWVITEEKLVEDDHLYVIIVARKGQWLWTDEFLLEVGPLLYEKKGPLYEKYVNYELETLEKILEGVLKGAENPSLNRRKADTIEKIKRWEAYR